MSLHRSQKKLQAQIDELIAGYLKTKRILVIDPAQSCRSSIIKALVGLGARTAHAVSLPSFELAEQEIREHQPQIIITEYTIDEKWSLDLVKIQRQICPDERQRIFIIATAEINETSITSAAEEDVNAFICKPFTGSSLQDHFRKTVLRKINPTEYLRMIDLGKTHLNQNEIEQAQRLFEDAIKISPSPALACFYLGKILQEKKSLQEAQNQYTKGLGHNPLHYRCLAGSFEVYQAQQIHHLAYQTIRKLAQRYPVSIQNLMRMIHLAVKTQQYQDLEDCFEKFQSMSYRSRELAQCICTGLMTAARHLIAQDQLPEGTKLLKKAAETVFYESSFLSQIIQELIEIKEFEEAENWLQKFSPDYQITDDYKVLSFLIHCGTRPLHECLLKGRKLVSDGVEDERLYTTLLALYLQIGKRDAAENLAYDAARLFPDNREYFLGQIHSSGISTE